jgi:hypothetical protein
MLKVWPSVEMLRGQNATHITCKNEQPDSESNYTMHHFDLLGFGPCIFARKMLKKRQEEEMWCLRTNSNPQLLNHHLRALRKNSTNNEAQCPPVTGVIVSQQWGDSIATME